MVEILAPRAWSPTGVAAQRPPPLGAELRSAWHGALPPQGTLTQACHQDCLWEGVGLRLSPARHTRGTLLPPTPSSQGDLLTSVLAPPPGQDDLELGNVSGERVCSGKEGYVNTAVQEGS